MPRERRHLMFGEKRINQINPCQYGGGLTCMICPLIDSRCVAEWVRNRFWPLWWRISFSKRGQISLNHYRLVFYHNVDVRIYFRVIHKSIARHVGQSDCNITTNAINSLRLIKKFFIYFLYHSSHSRPWREGHVLDRYRPTSDTCEVLKTRTKWI